MCSREENSEQEERGYPEVCTYTIESEDDYEDYQEGKGLYILLKLNSFYFNGKNKIIKDITNIKTTTKYC